MISGKHAIRAGAAVASLAMTHVPVAVLERFAAGMSSREENRLVVRHLLARCEDCADLICFFMSPPPVISEEYDAAIDRAFRRVLADQEHRGAKVLALWP